MATMAYTTAPRKPHHSDRCRCLSHLIEAGQKTLIEAEQKEQEDREQGVGRSWKELDNPVWRKSLSKRGNIERTHL